MNDQYLVKEVVQEFRDRIGDSSKSVPSKYIIAYLNTALRRLARQEGLEKLFEFRKTVELAAINHDGTPSASWDLGRIGTILDIPNLCVLYNQPNGMKALRMSYMEYDDFFQKVVLPEANEPGVPSFFTIEQIGPMNRIIFNRPAQQLVALDLKYSAFHPRITSENDPILINYNYADALVDYIMILHKIESTDMATGRALYEDLDVITADMVELLAKQPTGLPNRRFRRSF